MSNLTRIVFTLLVLSGASFGYGNDLDRARAQEDCAQFIYQENAQYIYDTYREATGPVCTWLPSRASRGHDGDRIPDDSYRAHIERGGLGEGVLRVDIREPGDHKGRIIEIVLTGIDFPNAVGECYGTEAGMNFWLLVSAGDGAQIWFEADMSRFEIGGPDMPAYVWFKGPVDRGPYLANELMVREGFATPTEDGLAGPYGDRLAAAQTAAQTEGLGLWGMCGGPHVATNGSAIDIVSGGGPGQYQWPGYDVDCPDISYDYAQWILAQDPSDPFRLDADGDGIACELN